MVDQERPGGHFDEHKVMLGYGSEQEARAAYLRNYSKNWKGLGAITPTTLGDFKAWLASGDTTERFADTAPKPTTNITENLPDAAAVADSGDDLVEIRLTKEGPWDFNDTYPEPNWAKVDAAAEQGRHVLDAGEGERDPVQLAAVLDEGIQELQIRHLDIAAARDRIATLEGGANPRKRGGSPSAEIEQHRKSIAQDERDINDIKGAHLDAWDEPAVDAMDAEAQLRAGVERRQTDPNVERPRIPKDKRENSAKPAKNIPENIPDATESPDFDPEKGVPAGLDGMSWAAKGAYSILKAVAPEARAPLMAAFRASNTDNAPLLAAWRSAVGAARTGASFPRGSADAVLAGMNILYPGPDGKPRGQTLKGKDLADALRDALGEIAIEESQAGTSALEVQPEGNVDHTSLVAYPHAGKTPIAGLAKEYLLEQGRLTGSEHILAFGPKGEVLAHGRGTSNNTGMSKALLDALIQRDRDFVVHHNHPRGTSLSPQSDAAFLAYPGLMAVWAHGSNGQSSRAELTQAARSRATFLAVDRPPQERMKAFAGKLTALDGIRKTLQELVYEMALTGDEASSVEAEVKNRALHRAGIIEYMTEAPDHAIFDHPDLVQAVEKAANDTAISFFGNADTVRRDDRSAIVLRHVGDLGGPSFDRPQVSGRRPAESSAGQRGREDGGRKESPPPEVASDPQIPAGYDLTAINMLTSRQEKPTRAPAAPEPAAPPPKQGLPAEMDLAEEAAAKTTKPSKTTKEGNDARLDELFASNKLFTADKVAAARARLKAKMSQINSGIDPELLIDGMTIAGAYVEAGVRSFADYAARMTEDLGDGIRPYLLSFWEAARSYPGIDTKGMTSAEESARLHAEVMKKGGLPASEAPALGSEVKAPKRGKKTGRPEDRILTQDWGVEYIDGYGTDPSRETGSDVKDAFLKDASQYLKAVSSVLLDLGYTVTTDRKGKPMRAVNINESGPDGPGDISLTLFHPETGANVWVHVGDTALRGVVPQTPSGIAVMFRSSKVYGDTTGTKGVNRWAPVGLSAGELAAIMHQEAGGGLKSADLKRPAVEVPDGISELDTNGQRPLEGIPAEEVSGVEKGGQAGRGAGAGGGIDLSGAPRARDERPAAGRGVGDREPAIHNAAAGSRDPVESLSPACNEVRCPATRPRRARGPHRTLQIPPGFPGDKAAR